MSAVVFSPITQRQNSQPQPTSPQSRIPVSSPSPLRRWGSLKARTGCEGFVFSEESNRTLKVSKDINQNTMARDNLQLRGLQKGYSFTERGGGTSTNGVISSAAATRPHNARTESRNSGGLNKATLQISPSRNRSLSLSLANSRLKSPRSPSASAGVNISPRTPPSSPDTKLRNYKDWDAESVGSTTSGLSVASCDHASVARNGTTFSGRSMKYVVHCSEHSGATGEDYLTPTQRAYRQVTRLKQLLSQAQNELEQKDSDILKLTQEVVELRLYKAALASPEDKSNSSGDAITVYEVSPDGPSAPDTDLLDGPTENHVEGEIDGSCADSGHFEDLTNSSVHSKDSANVSEEQSPYKRTTAVETADKSTSVDFGHRDNNSEHQKLVLEYERRLQELVHTHEEECHQMKQKHNNKVEELLQRLSEVNSRYWELLPDLDSARERIKELEQQLEEASKKLESEESKLKKNYLQMYTPNQDAGCSQQSTQVTALVSQSPSRISVPDLLHQLQATQTELENVKDIEYASSSNNTQPLISAKEAVSLWVLGARKAMYRQLVEAKTLKSKIDPEITLQFLKSAIYYFLTDRENNQGHLRAIQSILGFTPNEICSIEKARTT